MDYTMLNGPERDELERSPSRPPSTPTTTPRKRKKTSETEGESVRRLRRSHEACTRCRLKKIKASNPHFTSRARVLHMAPCCPLSAYNLLHSATLDTLVVAHVLPWVPLVNRKTGTEINSSLALTRR
jgi:hypothetical protein